MKSAFITLVALAGLAYNGSFFELWRLPHQDGERFTYRDAYRKMKKAISYEEDMLENAREEKRTEQEQLFRSSE